MIKIYLYRDREKKLTNHAWQHDTALRILNQESARPENGALIYHNITHSFNMVAVAFAQAPVGVDLELKRKVSPRLAKKILSPGELSCLQERKADDMELLLHWTLKESYGKALGVGIAYPLKSVELIPQTGKGLGEWRSVTCSDSRMSCYAMRTEDFVLSVCICQPGEHIPQLIF